MSVETICIEITNRCNLNCRTCYNRSGLNRVTRELSVGHMRRCIGLFSPYGLKRVLLSGGEPTLHADFDGVLDLIDEMSELSFGIVTNGTTHNPRLIDMLNTRANL